MKLNNLEQKCTKEQYDAILKNMNLAYITAVAAEAFIIIADDNLRQSTDGYRFENKKSFTMLKANLNRLLSNVDGIEVGGDAFLSAADFAFKIISELAEKVLTPEDEVKILSLIKNYK